MLAKVKQHLSKPFYFIKQNYPFLFKTVDKVFLVESIKMVKQDLSKRYYSIKQNYPFPFKKVDKVLVVELIKMVKKIFFFKILFPNITFSKGFIKVSLFLFGN